MPAEPAEPRSSAANGSQPPRPAGAAIADRQTPAPSGRRARRGRRRASVGCRPGAARQSPLVSLARRPAPARSRRAGASLPASAAAGAGAAVARSRSRWEAAAEAAAPTPAPASRFAPAARRRRSARPPNPSAGRRRSRTSRSTTAALAEDYDGPFEDEFTLEDLDRAGLRRRGRAAAVPRGGARRPAAAALRPRRLLSSPACSASWSIGGAAAFLLRPGATRSPAPAADHRRRPHADQGCAARPAAGRRRRQGKLIYDRVDRGAEAGPTAELVTPGEASTIATSGGTSADEAGKPISRVILPGGPGIDAPADGRQRASRGRPTTAADGCRRRQADRAAQGAHRGRQAGRHDRQQRSGRRCRRARRPTALPPCRAAARRRVRHAGADPPLRRSDADPAGHRQRHGHGAAAAAICAVDTDPLGPRRQMPAATAQPARGPRRRCTGRRRSAAAAAGGPAGRAAAMPTPQPVAAAPSRRAAAGAEGSPSRSRPRRADRPDRPHAPAGGAQPPAASGPTAQPPAAAAGAGLVAEAPRTRARADLSRPADAYPNILGRYQPNIQRADLGDRGVYYRVRVGPFAGGDAQRLCDDLKARRRRLHPRRH